MVHSREKAVRSVIQFWLPDVDDFDRILQLLDVCGYTDKGLALDDAAESGESNTIYEVTITRRPIIAPQVWREEVNWIENLHENTWQA